MNYFQKINLSERIERYKYIILSFIILIAAVLIETNTFSIKFREHHAIRFQKLLHNKEVFLQKEFDAIQSMSSEKDVKDYLSDNNHQYKNKGVSFLIYYNDTLVEWTNCPFILSLQLDTIPLSERVVFLSNSWYTKQIAYRGDSLIVGLVMVRNEFPYENKFLSNRFQSDFNVSNEVQLQLSHDENGFDIVDSGGEFLFSLTEKAAHERNQIHINISIVLYFVFIVILLASLHELIKRLRKRHFKIVVVLGLLVVLGTVRILMVKYKIPYIFYVSPLFDFQYFAASEFIPSLGDLLINVIVLLFFVVQIRLFIREKTIRKTAFWVKNMVVYLSPLVIALWYYGVNHIIKTMVFNSNVSFGLYNFLNLSFLSFVGIFIISLLLYSFVVLLNAYVLTFSRVYTLKQFARSSFVSYAVAIGIFFLGESASNAVFESLVFVIINLSFVYLYFIQRKKIGFYYKVLIMIIFAFYAQYQIQHYYEQRQDSIQRLYAISIADEHDPVAELLLQRLDTVMRNDSILIEYMMNPKGREGEINEYLQEIYFSGFLKRYELRSTVCGNSVGFEQANQLSNCEPYFNNFLKKYGLPLSTSNYHFINDYAGGLGYFTRLEYFSPDSLQTNLYIELTQKLVTEQLGYPELLLQDNVTNQHLKNFTFARYKENNLIAQNGDYPYSLHTPKVKRKEEFSVSRKSGYIHLHYSIGKDSEIIVSRRELKFFDKMVSFSYLFLFFFIVFIFVDMPMTVISQGYSFVFLDFKKRIQFSIISILLLSLLLIGGSMIYLNYSQYRDSQYENLKEKLFSVVAELNDKFQEDDLFDPYNIEMLYYNLVHLSNVYFTDINIYDRHGELMTSSRREIFDYQLTGNFIDYNAFYELTEKGSPFYIANDNIGDLNYTSAYMGLKDSNDNTIAFLNLPYFAKQEEFAGRLSSLIVTLINIYVMLILIAVAAAVFISGNIIKPLELLKQKLRNVSLGKQNEPIDWKSKDEIGSLIEHYNIMVQELAESAEMLAESERKGAWQEMARQIAHEIKNPLTPMKLNIQLLNRAWDSDVDDFGERLKRVSNTLVEQIDVLAATANEFSNFAKISEMNWDDVDLSRVLSSVIGLFADNPKVDIVNECSEDKSYLVRVDKKKLTRVFNNILKNAIQAIPKESQGKIVVWCTEIDNKVIVSIKDNGAGIKNELRSKLFEPNFTTKSSGSGLGLPICKSIIESFEGEIWFETEHLTGTIFFVKLPLL